jgi:hypothetical protein
MSKNKNLLNENTIRRMMKLASVDSLSDSFISTKYSPLAESVEEESLEESVEEETVEEGTKKDDELKDDEGGRGEKKGDKAYVNEEEDAAEEMEDAMDSMDDAEDKMDDAMDAMDDAEAAEDEVTLTDDEARDIIALADKLRAAMGAEEPEAEEELEMDMDAGDEEMEMDDEMEEEPGMRYDMMEEEENLYEAALSNLDIEIVEEKEVQLENLKKEIYKKVVNRLLKESKK